jgi:hypothetical protein
MRGRVAYYYGGLARTLELEREPSSLRCCVAAGCGVDERRAMSDHSASTTSLLAVCCRLSAAAGRTLYPRSGLGDSNSMRKPLCPQYTHTHTRPNGRQNRSGGHMESRRMRRPWAISLSPATIKERHGCLFAQRYDFGSRSFVLSLLRSPDAQMTALTSAR